MIVTLINGGFYYGVNNKPLTTTQTNFQYQLKHQPLDTNMSTNKSTARNSTAQLGIDLLRNPGKTKSTAFTDQERDQYKLRGLLPANVGTMQTQLDRVLTNMRRKEHDIEKYIFLSALQDRNERLFYRLVIDHINEIMPLIYTPTVGQACREFANIFRTEKGFYVTPNERGQIRKVFDNWPHKNVRIIVITDGARILGLGDLGANGMGIPIGKLALYCACAGIAPSECLPIMFDVGTNNQELLDDPVYLGVRAPRLQGDDYFSLMDELIAAANDAWPGVLIQFEDFIADNAFALLNQYQAKAFCFNDDIQGTAAVVLAGVYASTRISKIDFKDLRFLFLGAGSASSGIGAMIVCALVEHGLSEDEAHKRLWFFNRGGLVHHGRENLPDYLTPFAHQLDDVPHDFIEALESHRPHILIGATGAPNTFTEPIIQKMAQINDRPTIFALSNPTSRAECSAEQAYQWSEGRAIFASGSPYAQVQLNGQTFQPGQGNNAYIFPGVGLGMIACRAHHIPDGVFLTSARTLADSIAQTDLTRGALYPPLQQIREVSLNIAVAVAEYAWQHNLTDQPKPDDLRGFIGAMMYDPKY